MEIATDPKIVKVINLSSILSKCFELNINV